MIIIMTLKKSYSFLHIMSTYLIPIHKIQTTLTPTHTHSHPLTPSNLSSPFHLFIITHNSYHLTRVVLHLSLYQLSTEHPENIFTPRVYNVLKKHYVRVIVHVYLLLEKVD